MRARASILIEGKPVVGLRYWVLIGSTFQVCRCVEIGKNDYGFHHFTPKTSTGNYLSCYFFTLRNLTEAITKCDGEASYWENKARELEVYLAFANSQTRK